MTLSHTKIRRTAELAAVAVGAAAALTACGGDDGRAAQDMSASTSGTVVTDSSSDLGSIIIGWGEKNSDTEITTPKPDDVTARCYGNSDKLAVEVTAPHGWKINASNPSQTLAVANTFSERVRHRAIHFPRPAAVPRSPPAISRRERRIVVCQ